MKTYACTLGCVVGTYVSTPVTATASRVRAYATDEERTESHVLLPCVVSDTFLAPIDTLKMRRSRLDEDDWGTPVLPLMRVRNTLAYYHLWFEIRRGWKPRTHSPQGHDDWMLGVRLCYR